MIDDAYEIIQDLVEQFAYVIKKDGHIYLSTGGLSALEEGFAYLKWDDPKPAPELECQADGCTEEATCGTPTKDGYKWFCSKHSREYEDNINA